jgi:hypothetical protein
MPLKITTNNPPFHTASIIALFQLSQAFFDQDEDSRLSIVKHLDARSEEMVDQALAKMNAFRDSCENVNDWVVAIGGYEVDDEGVAPYLYIEGEFFMKGEDDEKIVQAKETLAEIAQHEWLNEESSSVEIELYS